MSDTRPWADGAVTGIGSLPGTDPVEAAALVFGELGALPHVPELPARGAGADMIGRSAALLVDLAVELVPSGWRVAAHPGRDLRRSQDFLAWDLDAVQAAGTGYEGPVKVQAVGPWTLAASLELATGHKIVTDPGAVRELTESLAEGVRVHIDALARRLPGAQVVLQLDEPSLPAVLAGRVSTPSGYGTVRPVEAGVAEQRLHDVLSAAPEGARVVHSCAADVPVGLLLAAGADAVSLDLDRLATGQLDALGEAIDSGMSLWLGCVPAVDAAVSFDAARDRLRGFWGQLGFSVSDLGRHVVPTPSCGMAGASPAHVRRVLSVLTDLGRYLAEESGS